MTFETVWGEKVKIPKGCKLNSEGNFQNGHGVEYAVVRVGGKGNETYYLETIYSKYVHAIELEVIQ